MMLNPLLKQSYNQGYKHGEKTFYSDQHLGVDWILGRGNKVYAPEKGTVERLYHGQGGNTLVLVSEGYKHRFMHLKRYEVEEGDTVEAGEVIALTGNTGMSTAPHLHWDIWDLSHGEFNLNDFEGFVDPQSLELTTNISDMAKDITRIKKRIAEEFKNVFGTVPSHRYMTFEAKKIEDGEVDIVQLKRLWKNKEKDYHKHYANIWRYVLNHGGLMDKYKGDNIHDVVEKNYNDIMDHYIIHGIEEEITDLIEE